MAPRRLDIPRPPCEPKPPRRPPAPRPADPGCGTGPDPRKIVERIVKTGRRRRKAKKKR